ncbi:MAG: hypothetical protein EBT38_06265, partial [Acidimicrobiia bacterium]|nr:hypothetical protein [Acidimicrobiia bacterium]
MIAELFSAVNSGAIAATPGGGDFVDISVPAWAWPALIGVIAAALLVDLLVFHRKAHVVNLREAA